MTKTQKKLLMIGLTLTILILWSLGMTLFNNWEKFINFWPITLMMAFGSFIAGATTEGGGAVAFPVLTLFFIKRSFFQFLSEGFLGSTLV